MKSIIKLVFAFVLLSTFKINAQVDTVSTLSNQKFLISTRVGYDILPMYDNETPYIDYKGGLELGVSLDYYWSRIRF